MLWSTLSSSVRSAAAALFIGFVLWPAAATKASPAPYFERNQGQAASSIRYIARSQGKILYLTCSEALLQLDGPGSSSLSETAAPSKRTTSFLRMRFSGANNPCRVAGTDLQTGRSHYFRGRDASHWVTDVPHYAKVLYEDVHPGIDLVFYGNEEKFEYDFVVAPGADPGAVTLTLDGADALAIDDSGRLIATLGDREVIQHRPFVYQPAESKRANDPSHRERTIVDGRWRLLDSATVGFEVADYDPARPLVIDPVISYSTYLNGTDEATGFDVAVDDDGAAYIVGETTSLDFPTTPGSFPADDEAPDRNAFITKINPAGDQVVFSTYLGPGGHSAYGVAVDQEGAVYLTGDARGVTDFPVTPGAFKTESLGNTTFVAKLSPDGSQLVYSTFLGDGGESGGDIAVDADGFAYVTGQTPSAEFPTTANAPRPERSSNLPEIYVSKLNQDGSALLFSTYWGGAADRDVGEGIAVDAEGNVYVTGHTLASDFPTTPGAFQTAPGGGIDGFLAKFDPEDGRVVYSTFLGGASSDWGHDVAVDVGGNAYVAGETSSAAGGTFPVTASAWRVDVESAEGFVTKFSRNGDALVYSTYVGGARTDALFGIAVDTAGHAYVAGNTQSARDLETVNEIPGAAGEPDSRSAMFAKLRTDGSGPLAFFGIGGGDDVDEANAVAVDGACNPYLTGKTSSKDFPVTTGSVQTASASGDGRSDAFVTKIDLSVDLDEPAIGCRGVVQATGTPTLRVGAPSSIMTAFGSNFAPPGTQALAPEVDGNGRVTTQLAGTCLEVEGMRAPIFAVLPGQINFQNPHSLPTGYASFRVIRGCGSGNEQASEPERIHIGPAAPAFFNFVNNPAGDNPIAALHQDGASFVGPVGLFGEAVVTTPAAPGEFVSLFATGFGATQPSFAAGQVPGAQATLATDDVQVTIGGIPIPPEDMFYVGVAPCCAGLYQLVVRIPPNAPAGNHAVIVTIAGRPSATGPYVAVQSP